VRSTYNQFDSQHVDWRLASHVSESAYEQIKHDAGGSAVIYGVPTGGNYSDFQNRVSQYASDLNTSLSADQAVNVMWTGLDPSSPSAYSTCLNAQVLTSRGLHLVVNSATKSDIALTLSWLPRGNDPSNIGDLAWSPFPGIKFPSTLISGETIVVIPRPAVQRTLAVNSSSTGFSDSIVLEPLQPPPPPISQQSRSSPPGFYGYKNADVIDREAELHSQWGNFTRIQATGTFENVCQSVGLTCEWVGDWGGAKKSCKETPYAGSRVAFCR
jgi:hypothetical protein